MMRIILMIIALLLSISVLGQQKSVKKVQKVRLSPPKIIREDYFQDLKKCFVYKSEVKKDSMVLQTNNILSVGSGDHAQLRIETKEYDPVKEKEANAQGNTLVWGETSKWIDGSYTIEQNILTFIPNKDENYKSQTFKLVKNAKTHKINYLLDRENHKYIIGNCPSPIISVGGLK